MICDETYKSTMLGFVIAKLKAMQDKEYMVLWRETGIPYFWLRKVAHGGIVNPGVDRVQFLYEYFTKKPLEIETV